MGDNDASQRALSKAELYEYYWRNEWTKAEIAAELGTSKGRVRAEFHLRGVPTHQYRSHETYVFAQLPKRILYERYWGEGLTLPGVGEAYGVSKDFVRSEFEARGIPREDRAGNAVAHDTDIPPKYQWPDDRTTADGSADSDATPGGSAGESGAPDPSKYLGNDLPSKAEIYELYWGYGLPKQETAAHLDVGESTLRRRMEQFGIPRRTSTATHGHDGWRPHHDSVPPKYKWPEPDAPEGETDRLWTRAKAGGD